MMDKNAWKGELTTIRVNKDECERERFIFSEIGEEKGKFGQTDEEG